MEQSLRPPNDACRDHVPVLRGNHAGAPSYRWRLSSLDRTAGGGESVGAWDRGSMGVRTPVLEAFVEERWLLSLRLTERAGIHVGAGAWGRGRSAGCRFGELDGGVGIGPDMGYRSQVVPEMTADRGRLTAAEHIVGGLRAVARRRSMRAR